MSTHKKLAVLAVLLAAIFAGCGTTKTITRTLVVPAPQAPPSPSELNHRPAWKEAPFNKHVVHGAIAPVTVPSKPLGPSGSEFKLVYADGFGAPLGSSDTTWKANTNNQGCCNNSNEIAAERPNMIRQSSQGLELACKHETVEGKSYVCGGMDTSGAFAFKPGEGQSFAFEVVTKFPPRDWGEDPGWWATDTRWTDEADFFEGWEWNHEEYFAGIPVWKAQIGGCGVVHEAYHLLSEIPNPETEFHTYTTVFRGNNTEEEYIDGKLRWTLGAPCGINKPWMHIILSHALRQATHMTSESVWYVKRVGVYEIGSGATEHAGIAPGTVVSGSTEEPPKTETTPPPPPKTETTPSTETTPPPPPPKEEALAAPTGCKAAPHLEGTVAWVSVSCNAVSGATSYRLYRTGPWPSWVGVGQPWTTGTTPSWTNRAEVTSGRRYCYWIDAVNAKGASEAQEVCARP